MKTISVDSNDFAEIRREGYVYVDKTAWFHRLATAEGRKLFFLARPRRFGKSLMISTLRAMFEGRKELFKGLDIMKAGWDWKKKYPVIHLNMGMCAASDYDTFAQNLPDCIEAGLAGAGVKYNRKKTPSSNFGNAIDVLAAKGKPPVILIDEYDDPVAKALKNPDVAERVRDALSPIYGQMKDRSGKIRFLMITGVSKFTKLSIFSTLSSLVDISFDDEYAAMLGYTEDEHRGRARQVLRRAHGSAPQGDGDVGQGVPRRNQAPLQRLQVLDRRRGECLQPRLHQPDDGVQEETLRALLGGDRQGVVPHEHAEAG